MVLTYKFKIKSGYTNLRVLANKVNTIWNYCNETSEKAIRRDNRFLSGFDLNILTTGSPTSLKINSYTVNAVCEQYAIRRKQFKKRKLKWRTSNGSRHSLGWVPFKSPGIKVSNDSVIFMKQEYRFFKSRDLPGPIKTGCFFEDSCGDWYVCFTCEAPALERAPVREVGIDLGLPSIASTSDGDIFSNPHTFRTNQEKLANAQRAGKKKQAARIHRKIARARKDNLHKISAKLTSNYSKIVVGDLKLKASKSINDASFRGLIPLLEYKASRRQGQVIRVNEAFSTVTCSRCLERSGPRGLPGLSVREWTCASCGQTHHRDINAATNILRIGYDTPMTSNELLAS